jgi:hypothetical protein
MRPYLPCPFSCFHLGFNPTGGSSSCCSAAWMVVSKRPLTARALGLLVCAYFVSTMSQISSTSMSVSCLWG